MTKELDVAAEYWASHRSEFNGIIRLYARFTLPGGILFGSLFSRARGAMIEVSQGEQIWSTSRNDPAYQVSTQRLMGNNLHSKRAVVVLSVTQNIETSVYSYLNQTETSFKLLINVIPSSGAGQQSIENAEQAVTYAMEVKNLMVDLKANGIEEIQLYLNCPLGVAVFVGHYLSSIGPIQVFDYLQPGYTASCLIG